MAYIGIQPAESFTSFATQTFSVSATTSYTLDHAVANENEIALFVNNVRQQPGSGKAYTATVTALTLSAATATTDTMYCIFLGRALQTVTPATNSVTSSMLGSNFFTGATDVGGALADADLLLIDDGAGGTLRKTAMSRVKTYVGGGITMASQWRLTTSFTGDAAPIASNWEQNDGSDPAVSYHGSQMTESSGVFTFPSTGIYYVELLVGYYINGDSGYNHSYIKAATNGSTFNTMTEMTTFITGNSSANTWASTTGSIIIDVRSTSEDVVRFDIDVDSAGTTIVGNSTRDITAARFIRLADT